MKVPCYGIPGDGTVKFGGTGKVRGFNEGVLRWCSVCAKASHPGAIDLMNKKCEECAVKPRNHGLLLERKSRWCKDCAAKLGNGAVPAEKWRAAGRIKHKIIEQVGFQTQSNTAPPPPPRRHTPTHTTAPFPSSVC